MAVDGSSVNSVEDLVELLNISAPGDEVTLMVVRGGETLEIEVTLGEWQDDLNQSVERRFERIPPPDDEEREFPTDRFRRFFCNPNDNGDDEGESACERHRQFSPPFGDGDGAFPRDFFERFFGPRPGARSIRVPVNLRPRSWISSLRGRSLFSPGFSYRPGLKVIGHVPEEVLVLEAGDVALLHLGQGLGARFHCQSVGQGAGPIS